MTTQQSDIDQVKKIDKNQYDVLYQISRRLNSVSYSKNLFEETLDIIIRVIDAERAVFVTYEEAGNRFSIVAARNVQQENIGELSVFSSGLLQKVITEKKPCIYHDVQNEPGLSQFSSILIHRIKSVLGVPVFKGGSIAGVVLADSQMNRKEFNEENLLFLDFFSNLVSLSLEKIQTLETLDDENRMLKNQLKTFTRIPEIIGESAVMSQLTQLIHRVAKTDATVLILGESGTGKELVARAIHTLSGRHAKPFIAQFCGSIPDTLLESELFGFKKGAFTGATSDKKGLFEVAHTGTFFLDEIADISMALQAKLLRVIQNKEINRLGDTQAVKVDARIIAATNKDLGQLSKEGKFREDLFYRLNVFPIVLPPLRERVGDVALLARFFVDRFFGRKIAIAPHAMKKLEQYDWPGNVRQLENVLQRAAILCDADSLESDHILLEEASEILSTGTTLEEIEKSVLMKRLKVFDGNRTKTAKSLGVSVRWIQMKLKEIDGDDEQRH